MTLRQRLLGAWSLQSYSEDRPGSAKPEFPLGTDAEGRIIYSPDGFMSAMLMRTGRKAFASNDWYKATDEELGDASAFISYSGTFDVDERSAIVAHRIDVSFFPNWIGVSQFRLIEVKPTELVLTPSEPILSGGQLVTPRICWARTSTRLPHIGRS